MVDWKWARDAIFMKISGTCPSDVRAALLLNSLHQDFILQPVHAGVGAYNRGSKRRDLARCVQLERMHSPSV